MSYTAEIKRDQPGCIVFLIDQSASMDESYGADPQMPKKAVALADVLNRLLQNLGQRCTRNEGEVYRYFDVAVLGYTTDDRGNSVVQSALGGTLAGKDIVGIDELANAPLRIEDREKEMYDGAGGTVKTAVKFPVWIEPVAAYGTPMCEALDHVCGVVENWIRQHPDSFPPIVFHITDGASTDGSPVEAGQKLQALSTSDGNVLLFNIHISESQATPLFLPASETALSQIEDAQRQLAEQLYAISSVLPDTMIEQVNADGTPVAQGARGFAFNTSLIALVQILDIGTRSANLR